MNPGLIEKKLGYKFADKNLLTRALTLPSGDPENNNQTMEFLGDAVLEFIVSAEIYSEKKTEGELTELRKSIVSDAALTPVSKRLGLDKFLIKSEYDTNNKKGVPSAYEAVTAAIYLDGGIDRAREFVLRTLDFAPKTVIKNYKGDLQELLQGKGLPKPAYSTEDEGTPQNHRFVCVACANGKNFRGEGKNKPEAEQNAAKNAYEYLKANS